MAGTGLCSGSFRELEEKVTSSDVLQMVCSPKMDLIALANSRNEVVLHRLSWQRVWTYHGADGRITSLVFKPDGKALAVGYINGFCEILSIENARCIHSLQASGGIVHMDWIQSESFSNTSEEPAPWKDVHSVSFNGEIEEEKPSVQVHTLSDRNAFNILAVADRCGIVQLYGQGVNWMGHISCIDDARMCLNDPDIDCKKISSVSVCSNMSMMSVVIDVCRSMKPPDVYLLTYNLSLIQQHQCELQQVSNIVVNLEYIKECVEHTIAQMNESWEDVLLEMDTKLYKVASIITKTGGSSICNDFLRLMMFGQPSAALETLLLMDLTEKNVKKLMRTAEDTYSNIQRLILNEVNKHAFSLITILVDLQGRSRWHERYHTLGVRENVVRNAVQLAMAFLIKSWELFQVVKSSLTTLKAFLQWIHLEIQQLGKEPVNSEVRQKVQEQTKFVAKFITDNFAEGCSETSRFKLEKIGQYFKRGKLVNPPQWEKVTWVQFLEEVGLEEHEVVGVYSRFRNDTFIEVWENTKAALFALQSMSSAGISQNCPLHSMCTLLQMETQEHCLELEYKVNQMTRVCNGEFSLLTAFTCSDVPSDRFCILVQPANGKEPPSEPHYCFFEVAQHLDFDGVADGRKQVLITSLAFFDNETITFLLQEKQQEDSDDEDGESTLARVHLLSLLEPLQVKPKGASLPELPSATNPFNLWPVLEQCKMRVFSHQTAVELAVNGGRSVAAVLFNSLRRIRLYLLDAEEEDEIDTMNDVSDLAELTQEEVPVAALTQETLESDKENSSQNQVFGF